ncbi:hypothetical protein BST61_g4265 [Cercospora zeina]
MERIRGQWRLLGSRKWLVAVVEGLQTGPPTTVSSQRQHHHPTDLTSAAVRDLLCVNVCTRAAHLPDPHCLRDEARHETRHEADHRPRPIADETDVDALRLPTRKERSLRRSHCAPFIVRTHDSAQRATDLHAVTSAVIDEPSTISLRI